MNGLCKGSAEGVLTSELPRRDQEGTKAANSLKGESMTIVALVMSMILVIGIALRSKEFGLRQYLVIFLITLVQVALLAGYLYRVQPPTLN